VTTMAEMFVVSLAKASRRTKRHLRGLSRDDKDDVLATAILWCWENRATYNPAVPLDDWFVGAIKNARRSFERGEARNSAELTEAIAVPDDASWSIELRQAANLMIRSMDVRDKRIVQLRMEGLESEEIHSLTNIPLRTIERKLARLRSMLPEREPQEFGKRSANIQDSDSSSQELAPIDREIERLEMNPHADQDCPPCWLCKWFDGYLPAQRRALRMEIVEPEVRAAVLATEARKIEIAWRVRA
jgi:RNA polymerase sigma factor (sigma-70 family)